MAFSNRRVVTGLNGEGKSCVISDMALDEIPGCQGHRALIWRTEGFPVNNDGNDDSAEPFEAGMFASSSSMFLMRKTEPGEFLSWHATDTIDYVVVLSGRFELGLEAESVEVGAGDLVIDRGVIHSWRTLGDEPAVMLAALVRAEPVGAGANLGSNFGR